MRKHCLELQKRHSFRCQIHCSILELKHTVSLIKVEISLSELDSLAGSMCSAFLRQIRLTLLPMACERGLLLERKKKLVGSRVYLCSTSAHLCSLALDTPQQWATCLPVPLEDLISVAKETSAFLFQRDQSLGLAQELRCLSSGSGAFQVFLLPWDQYSQTW